jgi:hypothetical protein
MPPLAETLSTLGAIPPFMRELLLTILFSHSLLRPDLAQEDDFDYSIAFAGCFENDKVALKLNGIVVMEPVRVTSNPVLGITKVGVFQDKEAAWFSSGDKTQKLSPISVNDSLSISVSLNGRWNDFKIDLRRGKTMLINACLEQIDGKNKRMVTVDQHKGTVLLD